MALQQGAKGLDAFSLVYINSNILPWKAGGVRNHMQKIGIFPDLLSEHTAQ